MSLVVRRALPDDVPAMSRVLTASITELCALDHEGDPAALAAWTRNKSLEGVAGMLANANLQLYVATRDDAVLAVGAVTLDGGIALNYVAPEARFSGVSTVLLTALEEALLALGHEEGRLESTRTAMGFYQSRGWVIDGPQAQGRMVNGYPMRKRLGI